MKALFPEATCAVVKEMDIRAENISALEADVGLLGGACC